MKKIITAAFIALGFVASSQTSIKLNLTNIGVGLYDIQVEQALTGKHAVSLGFGYMPNRNLLFKELLTDMEKDNIASYEESVFQGADFNGYRITPEFKLYTGDGEEGAKGVYWDVWLKYSNYSLVNPGYAQEYENLLAVSQVADFQFDASVASFGAGIGVGTQWFIKDLIALDILWLGIGYNHTTITSQYSSDAIDVDWDKWQEDASSATTGVGEYVSTEYSTIDNGIEVKMVPKIPIALRSSISLGIKF